MLVLRRVLFGFTAVQKTAIHNASHDHPKYFPPFKTPEICFLAPGIWTTSALEGTLCFPPWALKLNLPKVVRHWAWEKTSDSTGLPWEAAGPKSLKKQNHQNQWPFLIYVDLCFSTATPFNEHRDESAEWLSLLHRFHSLRRVNKNTLQKTNISHQTGQGKIIFKRCLFGERKR